MMTSSTHSFAYSYRLVKKCFVKICETSKCHNFLIFQPIFIRFSLLCLKFFTLSSKLKLNLLWSSSLRFKLFLDGEALGLRIKFKNAEMPSVTFLEYFVLFFHENTSKILQDLQENTGFFSLSL